MGATEKIAKWIVETSYEDIPPEVIEVAKQSCFDCLGVMLAGSVQPVGQIVQKYITEQGGSPEATLLGSGHALVAVQHRAGQRHHGPRPGLRRFRRLRPSHSRNLPAPAGPGRKAGIVGKRCAGGLRNRRGAGGNPPADHQVQPDGPRVPQHRRHRAHVFGSRVRKADGPGPGYHHHRPGYCGVHGQRADP